MTITTDQAQALIDKLKKDGYPGPFHFQPWGEQNQNGDYAESILFDAAYGETLVYGLPDAVGDLAVAAPDLARTVIDQAAEINALNTALRNLSKTYTTDILRLASELPDPEEVYAAKTGHPDGEATMNAVVEILHKAREADQ